MKNLGKGRTILLLLANTLVAPLMAFTLRGGDSFEIYLGKTLAVQQFLPHDKIVKTVDLSNVTATEELKVSFNHCGKTGTNRTVSLKDKSQVLKEWKFVDIKPGASTQMIIPVKDIFAIQKNRKGKQLSLFYASDLMKEGKYLRHLLQIQHKQVENRRLRFLRDFLTIRALRFYDPYCFYFCAELCCLVYLRPAKRLHPLSKRQRNTCHRNAGGISGWSGLYEKIYSKSAGTFQGHKSMQRKSICKLHS
jgi:hypothetical protein